MKIYEEDCNFSILQYRKYGDEVQLILNPPNNKENNERVNCPTKHPNRLLNSEAYNRLDLPPTCKIRTVTSASLP